MTPAWFCAPLATPEQTILETVAAALSDFDLEPPSLVALSQQSAATRDGAHVFALGSAREEGRRLGRGFFMDVFSDAFPVTFVGREEYDGTEIFEAHGPSSIYLASRPGFLGGQVEKLDAAMAADRSAVHAGQAFTKLRAGAATLTGARLFARRGGTLAPATGAFVNLIEPGINADSDLWPIPGAAPSGAPRTGKMDLDEAMQLLNQVGAALTQGGDLLEAKQIVERVIAAFPKMDRALALRSRVLEKVGSPADVEQAMRAAFDEGLKSAPVQRGVARASTIGSAALRLAEHLVQTRRAPEAREVIALACQVLHPDHAQSLRTRAGL
jgi:hypothetical protein